MAVHVIAVLALEGVNPFDLATPCEVFTRVRLPNGAAPYQVRVCGSGEVDAGPFHIRPRFGLRALDQADTILVPGVADIDAPFSPAVLKALRRAAANGTRLVSICTGAFVLAAAGVLDGLAATTHWMATDELARRHPQVAVDPGVLYVDNGAVLTSAGAAAGLDLCLHIVRRDHGSSVAADVARMSVMPLERDGGQAQFIVHAPPMPDGASLEPLLQWMEDNLHKPLNAGQVARRGGMSTRSLNRRFREQTGTTPAQWVLKARVRRAQALLETTAHSVERIAGQVGFGSAAVLRQHFRRVLRTSPRAYRQSLRTR